MIPDLYSINFLHQHLYCQEMRAGNDLLRVAKFKELYINLGEPESSVSNLVKYNSDESYKESYNDFIYTFSDYVVIYKRKSMKDGSFNLIACASVISSLNFNAKLVNDFVDRSRKFPLNDIQKDCIKCMLHPFIYEEQFKHVFDTIMNTIEKEFSKELIDLVVLCERAQDEAAFFESFFILLKEYFKLCRSYLEVTKECFQKCFFLILTLDKYKNIREDFFVKHSEKIQEYFSQTEDNTSIPFDYQIYKLK